MTNDILWLARLCIDQGLSKLEHFETLRTSLPETAELIDYAQRLIDEGIVHDVEGLERLAEQAMNLALAGPPSVNPFGTQAAVQADPNALGNKISDFPFNRIGSLGDKELAEAFRHLLRAISKDGASDLHLSAGAQPFVRKHRGISFLDTHVLSSQESMRLNTILLSPSQQHIFREKQDYDYALALDLASRYRVNLMIHKDGAAGSYRMVPATIPSLEELGFSEHIATLDKLLSYHNGLILVTGPVGAGKTTTLASMVHRLNVARQDHIITVEDPIEIVQTAKGCNVTQREVGEHTKSFFTALKGALREDPDVIVIGELRDLETIEMAITASETGHLVIGTMHTSDAATTLTRLLDVFPPSQQTQIRASVAESLRGIVCQRLLPSTQGGLVLACEILVNNTAIANLVKENKPTGLRNTMETGMRDGMCIMDNAVFNLREKGLISRPTAATNIQSRVLRGKLS